MPISFPWANALVYRAVGEDPPQQGGRDGERAARVAHAAAAGRAVKDAAEPLADLVARAGCRVKAGPAATRRRAVAAQEASAPREGGGREGGGERAGEGRRVAPGSFEHLNTLLARAERQVPDWKTINMRIPASPDAPVVFAIDRGDGGQPHLRSTLTLEPRDRRRRSP